MRIEPDQKLVIAKKLRQLREKNGYTQAELGRVIGRAYTTIASWESAKGQPDTDTLLRLLSLYGVENVLEEFGYGEPGEALSREERTHIQTFRGLSAKARDMVLSLGQDLTYIEAQGNRTKYVAARGGGQSIPLSLPHSLENLSDDGWPGDNK